MLVTWIKEWAEGVSICRGGEPRQFNTAALSVPCRATPHVSPIVHTRVVFVLFHPFHRQIEFLGIHVHSLRRAVTIFQLPTKILAAVPSTHENERDRCFSCFLLMRILHSTLYHVVLLFSQSWRCVRRDARYEFFMTRYFAEIEANFALFFSITRQGNARCSLYLCTRIYKYIHIHTHTYAHRPIFFESHWKYKRKRRLISRTRLLFPKRISHEGKE